MMRSVPVLLLCAFVLAACGGSSSDAPADASYADSMAQQHQGDTPEATAAVREPHIPVNAATVSYHTTDAGEAVTGYMAEPMNADSVLAQRGLTPDSTQLPGVVLIHEWWGLNDNIRAYARRVAGEGYRVLAVDLYNGMTAETPEGARDLMSTAMQNEDQLLANLAAAQTFLRTESGAPEVAVMGFCFGGGMALQAAVNQPKAWNGAVVYYGRVEGVEPSDVRPIAFPIVGFYGGQDGSIPVEGVTDFEEMLEQAGVTANIYIYEDAGHAFANPSGTSFSPKAAADAWDKATQFLRKYLYDGPPAAEPAS
ncbi:dienelactone hydrolase family protein [Salisaeta longa]|uniref:dienelactone hydrolase family protein n=1 Tax=Salisaeta longa TaxID=503170 RepID=UPI0003B445D9|nr:dienelactone hydrolase family protein [Salisaeta longa]